LLDKLGQRLQQLFAPVPHRMVPASGLIEKARRVLYNRERDRAEANGPACPPGCPFGVTFGPLFRLNCAGAHQTVRPYSRSKTMIFPAASVRAFRMIPFALPL